MGQLQSLDEVISFLLRRVWLISTISIIGIIIAVIAAMNTAPIYQATAAIQVQRAQISPASPSLNSAQTLQSIEQQLTSRGHLLATIERHSLFDKLPLTNEEKVNTLRNNIAFQGIEEAGHALYGQPAQISAILITAKADQADQAARIANDFAQSTLDMSSDTQIHQARVTFAFYDAEAQKLTTQIATLESQIAEHKNKNRQALPTTSSAQRDELVNLDNSLRALEQQKIALTSEADRLSQSTALRAIDKRKKDDVKNELVTIDAQISALMTTRETLYQALAALPNVERILTALERELEQAQTLLTTVNIRRAEAQNHQSLAERQQGDRFSLLDRAITPQWSSSGGRKKIVIAGAILSLLVALMVAFLLDLFRPVMRSSEQMQRQLGITPIIALPQFTFTTQTPLKRKRP